MTNLYTFLVPSIRSECAASHKLNEVIMFKHCKIQVTGRSEDLTVKHIQTPSSEMPFRVHASEESAAPFKVLRKEAAVSPEASTNIYIYIRLHGVTFKMAQAVFCDPLISPWLQHRTRRMLLSWQQGTW
jgi:hypothetical protein